jgi:uncharacterized protein (TIGR02284 family)
MGRASREMDVLTELLEVTFDSIAGYREAAALSDNTELVQHFLRRAGERERVAERIAGLIESLGGQPPDEGTALGAAHRSFMSLRSRFNPDNRTMLREVARGEHFLRSCYEDVLQDNVLSPRAHDAVRTAYGSVWSGEQAVTGAAMEHGLRPQAM